MPCIQSDTLDMHLYIYLNSSQRYWCPGDFGKILQRSERIVCADEFLSESKQDGTHPVGNCTDAKGDARSAQAIRYVEEGRLKGILLDG